MSAERKAIVFWLAVGAAGFLVAPWYALDASLFSTGWLSAYTDKEAAPALLQIVRHGRVWLLPLGLLLIACGALLGARLQRMTRANGLLVLGAAGFAYVLAQGFVIGPQGWSFEAPRELFGPLATGQYGIGLGAVLVGTAFAMLFALGLSARGNFAGDGFIAGMVVAVAVLTALFTFYPVFRILSSAFQSDGGDWSAASFVGRMFTTKVWGLGCFSGGQRCGVAWNTLLLALGCGAGSTALGLAFALVATRTEFPLKKLLRALSILPIITPPFVIGLGLILIFGRAGLVKIGRASCRERV